MALLFSPSIAGLMANNGIKNGFSTTATQVVISLHSGTKPSAANLIANWPTYNASGTTILWLGGGYTFAVTGTTMYASAMGAAATPIRDGTATWCVIWQMVAGAATTVQPFNTAVLSDAYKRFIIGDVSDIAGTGLVRIANTALTIAGGPVQISDAGLTITT